MQYITPTAEENAQLSPVLPYIEGFSEMSAAEKEFLHALVLRHKPKKVLELGVSAGAASAIILHALQHLDKKATLSSIDFSSRWYKDTSKRSGFVITENLPELAGNWTLYTPGIAAKYMDTIGAGIDFCLIDTMHRNPGEILDVLMVLPYLAENALVVFHDIALQTASPAHLASYTNSVLFSVLQGKKFLPANKHLPFANIGAIQLAPVTGQNIYDIFNLLLMPWTYLPGNAEYITLVEHFNAWYPEENVNLFLKAKAYYAAVSHVME